MLEQLRKLMDTRSSPRGQQPANNQENPLISQLAHLVSLKNQQPLASKQPILSSSPADQFGTGSPKMMPQISRGMGTVPSMFGSQHNAQSLVSTPDVEALAAMSFRSSVPNRIPRSGAASPDIPERG